jgi:hypothetical protein
LQDNKRYYDKMLSDWNFRPPSDVFWEAWWTWRHDWWYAILDTKFFFDRHSTVLFSPWVFFLTDITQFLLAHCYVALTNDMLKSYKVAQVWTLLEHQSSPPFLVGFGCWLILSVYILVSFDFPFVRLFGVR